MRWISYGIAAMIVFSAGFILFKRLRAFIKTGGRSACENCPYSGTCSKAAGSSGCKKQKRG